MDKALYAERMADLVLRKGVDLQKGEWLNINVSPDAYFYAQTMAQKAYAMGAKYVDIAVNDLVTDYCRAQCQSKDEVEFVPEYKRAFFDECSRENAKNVRIECADERINPLYSPSQNYQALNQAFRKARKTLGDRYMGNDLMWCVTCAPGPKWAKMVLGENASEEDLADLLSSILLIDSEDYLERWDEEERKAKSRIDHLNSLSIKTLHLKSSVTDLYITLRPEARFEGCSSKTTKGETFWPNLPTVEIFTTPDAYETHGYVTTTKPVNVLSTPTEEVRMTFEDGRCTKVEARIGKDTMEDYLKIDEGAGRLGEIALVETESPIAKTNLVFGSTLIDENASCHIALGKGYSSCLETDGKDAKDYGCNESLVHTDFMIGSPDMSIIAETFDGKEVKIMENGLFIF